jgi:hypothetical protein
MSEQPKDVKDLEGDELLQWFLSRPPLYTDSVEYDGMSLSFFNPDLDEEPISEAMSPVIPSKDRASA